MKLVIVASLILASSIGFAKGRQGSLPQKGPGADLNINSPAEQIRCSAMVGTQVVELKNEFGILKAETSELSLSVTPRSKVIGDINVDSTMVLKASKVQFDTHATQLKGGVQQISSVYVGEDVVRLYCTM